MQTQATGARIELSGVLEYRDKDGNIIGTTEFRGSVPLDDNGMAAEDARQLLDLQQRKE